MARDTLSRHLALQLISNARWQLYTAWQTVNLSDPQLSLKSASVGNFPTCRQYRAFVRWLVKQKQHIRIQAVDSQFAGAANGLEVAKKCRHALHPAATRAMVGKITSWCPDCEVSEVIAAMKRVYSVWATLLSRKTNVVNLDDPGELGMSYATMEEAKLEVSCRRLWRVEKMRHIALIGKLEQQALNEQKWEKENECPLSVLAEAKTATKALDVALNEDPAMLTGYDTESRPVESKAMSKRVTFADNVEETEGRHYEAYFPGSKEYKPGRYKRTTDWEETSFFRWSRDEYAAYAEKLAKLDMWDCEYWKFGLRDVLSELGEDPNIPTPAAMRLRDPRLRTELPYIEQVINKLNLYRDVYSAHHPWADEDLDEEEEEVETDDLEDGEIVKNEECEVETTDEKSNDGEEDEEEDSDELEDDLRTSHQ